jgi:hypothetical protein
MGDASFHTASRLRASVANSQQQAQPTALFTAHYGSNECYKTDTKCYKTGIAASAPALTIDTFPQGAPVNQTADDDFRVSSDDRVARLRRLAAAKGMVLSKAYARNAQDPNFSLYLLADAKTNSLVFPHQGQFTTLDEIEEFLGVR